MSHDKACAQCGVVFRASRSSNVYCSPRCCDLARATTCEQCGHLIRHSGSRTKSARCGQCGTGRRPAGRAAGEPTRRAPIDLRNNLERHVTVALSGCWEWAGSFDSSGYPQTGIGGKRVRVHRAVLEIRMGAPLGTQQAHHVCANRRCVNPDHLQPASLNANMAEMMLRHAYVARIQELEATVREIAPGHEVLQRIPLN